MSRYAAILLKFAAVSAIALVAACSHDEPRQLASNPPPHAPGPNATWYHVNFDTNSYVITPGEQKTVADVTAYMQQNPGAVATIIGKTDTVGTHDYNIHLSHQRADAVRDALVYNNNIAANRVETRWTGEGRQDVATANDVATASNRVVDIAIH